MGSSGRITASPSFLSGEQTICLTNSHKAEGDEYSKAYKVFAKTVEGELRSPKYNSTAYPTDEWTDSDGYGFFAFINKQRAEEFIELIKELEDILQSAYWEIDMNVAEYIVKEVEISGLEKIGYCGTTQEEVKNPNPDETDSVRFHSMKIPS